MDWCHCDVKRDLTIKKIKLPVWDLRLIRIDIMPHCESDNVMGVISVCA
jgi:hypothetical protein